MTELIVLVVASFTIAVIVWPGSRRQHRSATRDRGTVAWMSGASGSDGGGCDGGGGGCD
jgi:hypothetical protein